MIELVIWIIFIGFTNKSINPTYPYMIIGLAIMLSRITIRAGLTDISNTIDNIEIETEGENR